MAVYISGGGFPLMIGTYTPFRPLTWSDQQVFDKAFDNIVGVSYIPYAVSTQVANGINYKFLCTQSLVTQDPVKSIVIVPVHCSITGRAKRLDDVTLNFNEP
jgi:hypothetical protein